MQWRSIIVAIVQVCQELLPQRAVYVLQADCNVNKVDKRITYIAVAMILMTVFK